MPLPGKPRVKLPEAALPKLATPGLNSWAQEESNEFQNPTNRAKYEIKGHSVKASITAPGKQLEVPKPRQQIRPATPLDPPNPLRKDQKLRAATEPVVPKASYTRQHANASDLQAMQPQASSANKDKLQAQLPSGSSVYSDSAPSDRVPSRSGFIANLAGDHRSPPPVSAPPSTEYSNPLRGSLEDRAAYSTSPPRQVKSNPLPPRRYSEDTDLPTPPPKDRIRPKQEVYMSSKLPSQDDSRQHAKAETDRHNVPRIGNYERFLDDSIVEANEGQRITSYAGIIENVGDSYESESNTAYNQGGSSLDNTLIGLTPSGRLPAVAYSPSNYGRVWENDPHVGTTLPPFSPSAAPYGATEAQKSSHRNDAAGGLKPPVREPTHPGLIHPRLIPNALRQSSQGSGTTSGTIPFMYRGDPESSGQGLRPQRSLLSTNSWAQGSRNSSDSSLLPVNSQAAGGAPIYMSAATRAVGGERMSHHSAVNSVPPPPNSHPDFQASAVIPPGLGQLELAIHHHIDSSANFVSRMVEENHNKVLDKVLRRMDDMEDSQYRASRRLQEEMNELKKVIGNMRSEVKTAKKDDKLVYKMLNKVDGKMVEMETNIQALGNRSPDNPQGTQAERHTVTEPSQTATTAGHSSAPRGQSGGYEGGSPHHSGPTASVSGQHQTSRAARRRSSRAIKGGAEEARREEHRARGAQILAEVASMRLPAPNINDHPAYRGNVQEAEQSTGGAFEIPADFVPPDTAGFQKPTYSNGNWFRQVYKD